MFESKILLVYGISGTGKTSLINCGLANKFEDSDWLPVNVRRGRNVVESLVRELRKVAISDFKSAVHSPQSAIKDLTPVQIVKALQSIYLDHFKPIYLIFDQLEELFIFGDREEREEFIQIVKAVVDSDVQCRFIFSIREEYLAEVTEFERVIPEFPANRMRIEKMTSQNAIHVIEGPCNVHEIEVEEGFPEALLTKLNPDSNEVELTYLQVFLDKIYRLSTMNYSAEGTNYSTAGANDNSPLLRGAQGGVFTIPLLEKVGDVTDLLGSFLEEQISALDDPNTGLTILKSFVSLKGTRKQISEEEIQDTARTFGQDIPYETLKEYLQQFVNLRILKDKDETGRYELRHDSLADKIYEKITLVEKEMLEVRQFLDNAYGQYEKRKIHLTTKDLKYIAPYEDKLFINKETEKFIEESKNVLQKAKKKIKRIAIAGFVAILIISTSTIFRTFNLPFGGSLTFAGWILYIAWFLPLFSFYVFKTKENRTINLLFLIFTLFFLGTIYLYKKISNNMMYGPVIVTEQKIQNTIEYLSSRNEMIYFNINNIATENPDKTNQYKNLANQVNARTNELFNYIQDMKIEIVSHSEGIKEDDLREFGINIERLKNIEKAGPPSEILIGPHNDGKAFDLKAIIIDYKQFLSGIVRENPTIKELLEKTLSTDDPIGEGESITWEHFNFLWLPVGFTITTLSKIQSEIKYAELEVLSYLFDQIAISVEENK
ncbi:hypothetical protein ES705_18727 [subsurface metagenome]